MTLDEFKNLIDAYGADRNRWPDDRQGAAEQLLEASEPARELLAEAEALDRLLAQVTPVAVSPAFKERIAAIPGSTRQERRAGRRAGWRLGLQTWVPRFAGMTAALALGFYIGTLDVVPVEEAFFVAEAETVDLTDYFYGDFIEEAEL